MNDSSSAQPQWHVSRDGKQFGPFSAPDLFKMAELGKLRPNDLFWKPGYDSWKPASEIPGLLTPPTPPTSGNELSFIEPASALHSDFGQVPVSQRVVQTTKTAGAWRRFSARLIDVYLMMLVVMLPLIIGLVLLIPDFGAWLSGPENKNSVVLALLAGPVIFLADAVEFGIFGNTLGKALLNVRVVSLKDGTPTFTKYLKRNFLVWAAGLGLSLPLVNLVAMFIQRRRLGKGKPASYDEGQFDVRAGPLTWWRVVLALIIGFGLVGGFFYLAVASDNSHDDVTGLTGATRSSFVRSAVESCAKTTDKETLSPSLVSQYCTCYANSLADKLSNNEVKQVALEKSIGSVQPKVEASAEACLKEVVPAKQ
jgi:uncharacterized RDD family membrane protein YckC